MTSMLPGHYHDGGSNPGLHGGGGGLYGDHPPPGGQPMGHPGHHPGVSLAPKPKFFFKMPRVVHDQKNKFDNDELFRRLSRDSEVRYTGYRDRPMDERRQQFQKCIRAGLIEIAIVSNGTNINLHFGGYGNNNDNNNSKDIDTEKEPGKIHIRSPFILNGVCVRWRGWMDVERLDGQGVVEYDEESAREETRVFQEEIERHKHRLRDLDDKQRLGGGGSGSQASSSYRQPSSSSGSPTNTGAQPATAAAAAAAAATAAAAAALHHHHQLQHHHHHHHHQYHPGQAVSESSNIQVR